jgi:hypothetical protein
MEKKQNTISTKAFWKKLILAEHGKTNIFLAIEFVLFL